MHKLKVRELANMCMLKYCAVHVRRPVQETIEKIVFASTSAVVNQSGDAAHGKGPCEHTPPSKQKRNRNDPPEGCVEDVEIDVSEGEPAAKRPRTFTADEDRYIVKKYHRTLSDGPSLHNCASDVAAKLGCSRGSVKERIGTLMERGECPTSLGQTSHELSDGVQRAQASRGNSAAAFSAAEDSHIWSAYVCATAEPGSSAVGGSNNKLRFVADLAQALGRSYSQIDGRLRLLCLQYGASNGSGGGGTGAQAEDSPQKCGNRTSVHSDHEPPVTMKQIRRMENNFRLRETSAVIK
jgi:hypothetical protein